MSLILAPPIASTGDPKMPLRKRKMRSISISLANTVGICRATKTSNVAMYIGLRPMRIASDSGDQNMTPSPYPMMASVVPKVATSRLTPKLVWTLVAPGEYIEVPM